MARFKITYRPFRHGDVKLRTKWLSNFEVNKNLSWHVRGVGTTEKKQEEWFGRYIKDPFDKRFIIFADRKPVGIVGLTDISPVDHNAELYIFIGEDEFRGKGIGTEALKFILDYGFKKLKLHKIGLRTNGYNEGAIKLYKRFGFKEEGRLKDQLFYNKKHYDLVFMGLFEGER